MTQKDFVKACYAYSRIISTNDDSRLTIESLPTLKDDTVYKCNDQYILLRMPTEIRVAYNAKPNQLVAVAKYMVEKEHFSITD